MISGSTRTCAHLLDAAELLRIVRRSLDLGTGDCERDLLGVLRRNKVPLLSLAGDARAVGGLRPMEGKDDAGAAPRPPAGEISARADLALLQSAAFRAALEEDRAAYAQFHSEYVQLAQAWARAGVRCICFKSAGIAPSFPYTSDNVDVLVPAQGVAESRRILLDLRYVEMTNTEEPLKWLFRRFHAGRNVSLIHLHAQVGWDAGFMLEDEIWARARPSADDPWTWVPGREDAVLINVAHALIENKALSLHDLVKIRYALSGGAIDWAYLDRVAAERGWRDCLHLGLLLVAHLEEQLSLRSTVPPDLSFQDLVHREQSSLLREALAGSPARSRPQAGTDGTGPGSWRQAEGALPFAKLHADRTGRHRWQWQEQPGPSAPRRLRGLACARPHRLDADRRYPGPAPAPAHPSPLRAAPRRPPPTTFNRTGLALGLLAGAAHPRFSALPPSGRG